MSQADFRIPRAIRPAIATATPPKTLRRSIPSIGNSRTSIYSPVTCSTSATTGKHTRLGRRCGRLAAAGTTADFLKALIKLAAAGVKAREGRRIGVVRHAHRAVELITSVQSRNDGTRYAGLDLGWLLAVANRLASDPPLGKSPTAPVEVIFDFAIWPS